jgi:hypothetical protein
MAGWSPQGRLTASASPIEQSSTLDPTTPPPVPKSAKGRQEKEGKTNKRKYSVPRFALRPSIFRKRPQLVFATLPIAMLNDKIEVEINTEKDQAR